MTKQATTNHAAAIATAAAQAAAAVLNAGGTEEQAAAAVSSIFAALTNSEAAELAPMASEATKAPAAPKAPKPEAGHLDPEAWASYRTADGTARMGKAKNLPKDARDVKSHANQGQALQRRNALAKADAAPTAPEPQPEAPKPEAAPVVMESTIPAPVDERAARIDKRNAAIIATIPLTSGKNPEARRQLVANKLAQVQAAGYRYARLVPNKEHQRDALSLFCGEKGHGHDAAFQALVTEAGAKHRAAYDEARKHGEALPTPPARVWYWSPARGGKLYIRGIFGPVSEA